MSKRRVNRARCAHIERIPLALDPGQTVRGGIRAGQCKRPALPRLVVCEHHATPDAVRMVILAMDNEIECFGGTSCG